MKDLVTKRIEELIKEINGLLEAREKYVNSINRIDSDISAKQGAVFELKKLMDAQELVEELGDLNEEDEIDLSNLDPKNSD